MDELLAAVICGSGMVGLCGLLGVAVWESAKRGNRDGYRALQNRCYELSEMLNCVEDDRNRLALRVVEMERYYAPYRNVMKRLDAQDRQRAALKRENQDLKQRLDGARILVMALAAKAGVRVTDDPGGGWRAV